MPPVPLDPIVSLSVAIAEAPGSYAFFLGSGVSKDAGVPTGGEVFWRAVEELYRLENSSQQTPGEDELQAWLSETGRAEMGYSEVLELIAPDAASRRDYLAKHFEGVAPEQTHERLADLAARGLIKVFVTTNFDRLLEHALQARGIEPVVITTADQLERAPAREHARCYVLKPHGDYLQQTIRNTRGELAQLEERMAQELQEVFDRYGLLVLGYSGSDEAIAAVMRARRGRYGLYWLGKTELAEPARSLVEAVAGRTIIREGGAGEFLADLGRRLEVFSAHPSGQTPLSVHDQVLLLLRRGDRVGLSELLRDEQRALEVAVGEAAGGKAQTAPTVELLRELHDRMLPALERRLASLLPLLLHESDVFAGQIQQLAAFKSRAGSRGSYYTFWGNVPSWCCWWLGLALGAFGVRQGRIAQLRPLLTARASKEHGVVDVLVPQYPGDVASELGDALNRARQQKGEGQFFAPAWMAFRDDLLSLELLTSRYPEMVDEGNGEPTRSLVEFDFVQTVAVSVMDAGPLTVWTMYETTASNFGFRLYNDTGLRAQVAEAVGLSLEAFDEQAATRLRKAEHISRSTRPSLVPVRFLEMGRSG